MKLTNKQIKKILKETNKKLKTMDFDKNATGLIINFNYVLRLPRDIKKMN